MTARNWKPGDVQLFRVTRWSSAAEWPENTDCVLMRLDEDGDYWEAVDGDPAAPFCVGVRLNRDSLHPLVAIDLPDGALAGWPVLIEALKRAKEATGYDMIFGGLIEQIERQIKPPKPDEPLGLGAVVEDAEGKRWVRFADNQPGDRNWASGEGDCNRNWSEIDVTRVVWGGTFT